MSASKPQRRCHHDGTVPPSPGSPRGQRALTGFVDAAEAGQGGVQPGTLLAVGTKLLHGGTDLVIGHVQQILQAQLPGGDFLREEWVRNEGGKGSTLEHPLNPGEHP